MRRTTAPLRGVFPAAALFTSAILAARPAIAAESAAGTITATVDIAPEEIIEHIGSAYRFVDVDVVEISASLSEPAPAAGITLGTVSSLVPPLGSMFFGFGETSASVFETFPTGGFTSFYPGFALRMGYFGLTNPPPGVEIGQPNTLWHVQTIETGTRGDVCRLDPDPNYCCAVNYLACLLCSLGWGNCKFCPFGAPADVIDSVTPRLGPGWVMTLQRYRDEVLATTSEGQIYVGLYMANALDIMRAITVSPTLALDLFYAKDDWVAALQGLVDGQGDQFAVTPSMQDDLTRLLDEFERVGSPELAAMIAFQRNQLSLDALVGLSMNEFQQQVESGASPVEPSSWGRIKTLYRDAPSPRR
jgi:hypothetical protein